MFAMITPSKLAEPILLLLLAGTILFVYLVYVAPGRTSLPPGPKPLPFVGNILQLPQTEQHVTFTQWGVQYGDIVYAKLFQKDIIILNSARAAVDLLGKRGANYSGRPRFVYLSELVEWTAAGSLMTNNATWRQHRKWTQQTLMTRVALDSYKSLQRREANRLLLDILQNSSDFRLHFKRYVVAIILNITYGRSVTSLDDDFIRLVDQNIGELLETATLVDFFPVLRYVPAWFPGAGFKRTAARAREAIRALEDIPYEQVKEEMAADTAKPSLTQKLIEECEAAGTLTARMIALIKSTAGGMYVAGTDTTSTAPLVFILQMVLHPEILRRAQDEMGRVIGDVRLPDFEDRPSLPYLECILREVYRICPAGPLGLPHQTAEDDVYRGYRIPRNTTVIANIWAMMRDPEYFEDPEDFRPERFLGCDMSHCEPGFDPRKLVFGFGRRACTGQYLADNTIWLAMARLVATMDIRKARDSDGVEITPDVAFVTGTVCHPGSFVCDIQPRSEKAKQLILDSCFNL